MVFILDNDDSFTYNLYQYFGELGEEVLVRRKTECTIEEIESLKPDLIVISPGPGRPNKAPFALRVIERFKGRIPILGVCLGHQAIGQHLGGQVIQARSPRHGKVSLVKHDGQGVFAGLPTPLTVARYHSLALNPERLPAELIITAQSEDGEIMGIRHRDLPLEGIQFHPEAILTEYGHELLQNALEKARTWLSVQARTKKADQTSASNNRIEEINGGDNQTTNWKIRSFVCPLPPYRLLQAFKSCVRPFFLDSGEGYSALGRYSWLGAFPFLEATAFSEQVELVYPEKNLSDTIQVTRGKTLENLDALITKYQVSGSAPFPFAGGAVGFLSYDLKDEIENLEHEALDDLQLPLWRFAWYDGIVVYDHSTQEYWLTAIGMNEEGCCLEELAESRVRSMEKILNDYLQQLGQVPGQKSDQDSKSAEHITIQPSVSRAEYFASLQRVLDYIVEGDIYQANLTQRFTMPFQGDAWKLYHLLHERNPAPFAAFLPYPDFQVLCSSPERFLKIERGGGVETRPIKGTRPRGNSPEEDGQLADELLRSAKDKAEHTMIVDLERNDLGRLCTFGSVRVSDFLSLEKYPTVWHLVSTVSGQLREKLLPSEILKALFPGGSITGAPKIRAMEIIEESEPYKRGIYTGSIGYIGFNGVWDLNIVIRTILIKEGNAYVQAGGGIVADSDPIREYEETTTKAAALFRVLGGKIHD